MSSVKALFCLVDDGDDDDGSVLLSFYDCLLHDVACTCAGKFHLMQRTIRYPRHDLPKNLLFTKSHSALQVLSSILGTVEAVLSFPAVCVHVLSNRPHDVVILMGWQDTGN